MVVFNLDLLDNYVPDVSKAVPVGAGGPLGDEQGPKSKMYTRIYFVI